LAGGGGSGHGDRRIVSEWDRDRLRLCLAMRSNLSTSFSTATRSVPAAVVRSFAAMSKKG
jgi:hypothetical protein